MKSKVICIAGAHRSGTSMLTRLLHAMGLALGAKGDLMPAAADNPDGFWENLRFVHLNDEILNAVGSAWDLPPLQDESFNGASIAPMRAKARLLLTSFELDPIWGWKDPRTCLTLPFWRSLLPEVKTVIMVRNPLEVAYSMNRRNATSYALGLRLWEIYNRRLLRYTLPAERIVTSYQTFFEQPESELMRIATFCDLPQEKASAAAALIQSDRRHTTFSIEQLIDAGLPEAIIGLYSALLDEAAGRKDHASVQAQLQPPPASSRELHELAGVAAILDSTIPETETVHREAAAQRDSQMKVDAFRHELENLRQELSREQTRAALELGRRDGRIQELQSAYSHLDELLLREQSSRNELLEQLKQAREQLNEARERFTQTNRLLHSYSVQLTEREAAAFSFSERLRKQLQESKRLLKLLGDTEQAADLLRQSRRWILVNPFAWAAARFSGRPLRGFGHLDRVVSKYHAWRSAHPEAAQLDSAIAALRANHPETLARPDLPPRADATVIGSPKPSAPLSPIEFPSYENVQVSIVIPVFNQFEFTQACLASLQKHETDIPFEVIVVDDCSTDGTEEGLLKVPGLVYHRKEENSGFIVSCNLGAERARGRYIVFLNNDTIVHTGWLKELYETFAFEPRAGLVGSKLVYPDGRLQEAGGIIWRDATGWNRGKFHDAGSPEYNFLREVDYCSAASVMISKSLFLSLGGFDLKYQPAYYEDTDLAFKVAAAGHKVLYQPLSVVTHYEGATGGTDISAGTKKYQELNRATFACTWPERLAAKPVNGDLPGWEALPQGFLRILVIDHHLPLTDRDSGSLRMFHILTLLHELGHRVTFIPDNLADIPPHGDALRRRGIEFLHHPYIKHVRDHLEEKGGNYDVVILSRRDFARKHIDDVRRCAPRAHLIFDTVDLHFLREEREADLTQDSTLARQMEENRCLEYGLVEKADETWVVSPIEKQLLQREIPDTPIHVVSNIVPVAQNVPPFSLRRDALFIGSFQHTPNIDAVLFFVREILPLVHQTLPELRLYVIGDKAPPEIVALADERIIVTGYQPDVRVFFDGVKLSVAPLRYGAGVKGKINQSMGFGVPVVATQVAAEGMGLKNGEDILTDDDPKAFADAIVRLYSAEDLWNRLSRNSLAKTTESYSLEAARKRLSLLLSVGRLSQAPSRSAAMSAESL